jgi:hypothetical protein
LLSLRTTRSDSLISYLVLPPFHVRSAFSLLDGLVHFRLYIPAVMMGMMYVYTLKYGLYMTERWIIGSPASIREEQDSNVDRETIYRD